MTIISGKQYYYIENGMQARIIDKAWLDTNNYTVIKSIVETGQVERFFTIQGTNIVGEILFEVEQV